ncbi:hypothetical protein [Rhodococcus opacus]|uniref:hypothetical protein n=1 Tax=Rhodococcus opacus TaxID=37919 RepID=UPI001009B082|nr:hypothetical protein [Rhodococcus opacus]
MWNMVRIFVATGVIVFLLAMVVSSLMGSRTEDGPSAFDQCVDEAATHLFYAVPDLTYKQAKAQAMTSPRCSALK